MRSAVVSVLVLHLTALSGAPAPSIEDLESVISRNRDLTDLLIPLLQANLEARRLDQAGHNELLKVFTPKRRKESVVELVPVRPKVRNNRKRPLALIVASQIPEDTDDHDQDGFGETDLVKKRRIDDSVNTASNLDKDVRNSGKKTDLNHSETRKSGTEKYADDDTIEQESDRISSRNKYGSSKSDPEVTSDLTVEDTNSSKRNDLEVNVATDITSDIETEDYDAEDMSENITAEKDSENVDHRIKTVDIVKKGKNHIIKHSDSTENFFAISNEKLVTDRTKDLSGLMPGNLYKPKENITWKLENNINETVVEENVTEGSRIIENENVDEEIARILENIKSYDKILDEQFHKEYKNSHESSREERSSRQQQAAENINNILTVETSETQTMDGYVPSNEIFKIIVKDDSKENDETAEPSEQYFTIENESNDDVIIEKYVKYNDSRNKEHQIYRHNQNSEHLSSETLEQNDENIAFVQSSENEHRSFENDSYEDVTDEDIVDDFTSDTSERDEANEQRPTENITGKDSTYDDDYTGYVSKNNYHGSSEENEASDKFERHATSEEITEDYTNDDVSNNGNFNKHGKPENTEENATYDSYETNRDVTSEDFSNEDIYQNNMSEEVRTNESYDGDDVVDDNDLYNDDDENTPETESYETEKSDEDFTNEDVTDLNVTYEDNTTSEELTGEDITSENLTQEDLTNEYSIEEDMTSADLTNNITSENLTDEDLTREDTNEFPVENNSEDYWSEENVTNESESALLSADSNEDIPERFGGGVTNEKIIDEVTDEHLFRGYEFRIKNLTKVNNIEEKLHEKRKRCKNKVVKTDLNDTRIPSHVHEIHKSYKLSFRFNK